MVNERSPPWLKPLVIPLHIRSTLRSYPGQASTLCTRPTLSHPLLPSSLLHSALHPKPAGSHPGLCSQRTGCPEQF